MPEIDAKAMKFVEDTLKKNPKIELEDLFERAKKVSPPMRKLSRRQFNARYPLQVKRRRAQAARSKGAAKKKAATPSPRGPRTTATKGGGPRDAVREVLLQFATDITAAEERRDLVRVLAGVDRYVDQVLKGAAKT